ncbi:MAG: ribonuclease J [Bacteriovoracaceae bacterium]
MKSVYSITPVGGVKEIGSNMTVVKTKNQWVIIDAGILFPYDDFFDLRYLIPDYTYLDESLSTDLVITHGHEDHIGAVLHVLDHLPEIKVWAPAFAGALIRKKAEEKGRKVFIHLYDERSTLEFLDVTIKPYHVNHSIPQTYGLLIQDKEKICSTLYISDFKVDLLTSYEKPIDLPAIKKAMEISQVRLGLLDSTNILNKGKSGSEAELIHDLEEVISGNDDRIFITLFASNIHRLKTIFESAAKSKKKIAILGRSIKFYVQTARELGLLDVDEKDLLDLENERLEGKKVIVLVSGCQGDFHSALRRLVDGEVNHMKLKPGDLMVFSSKTIPGNEKKLAKIYNKIYEQGARALTAYDKTIHASGHPGQSDLKEVYSSLDLTDLAPIHGESYFLQKHIDFVKEYFPKIKTHLIYNFTTMHIHANGEIKLTNEDAPELIFIHGQEMPIPKKKISERRKMATQGTVLISIHPEKNQTKVRIDLVGLPEIESKLSGLKELITDKLNGELKNKDLDRKEEELKIEARRFFNHFLGYKPVTVVHII